MENMIIRDALKANKVRAWELAEALGIVDCTLSKWMRRELPKRKQEAMIETIERIAKCKREKEAKELEAYAAEVRDALDTMLA